VESGSYDYEPLGLIEFQRELSAAIAEQISLKLSPARLDALARRHSRDAEAVDLYLRGQFYWNQLTPATTQRAVEYFESATRRDPDYALPWAGIAVAYAAAPINADAMPLAVWPKARDAADRAIRADPTLAEAQAGLGVVQFWLDWNWPAAEASFVRAVDADPNYAFAQRMVGIVRSHLENHPAATASMRRLRELEPSVAMNHALSAQVSFHTRDFTTAVKHANQAGLIDPAFWIARYQAALALEQLGEYDRALEAIGPVTRVNSKALSLEGYIFAKAGRTADARRVLGALAHAAATRYVPPYASALVHAGLGERDAALQQLERALEMHDVHLSALPVDPKWDSFRQDPRFVAIVEGCGFTRQRNGDTHLFAK
jgi:tetratricopeptide (TPR) repeat protein